MPRNHMTREPKGFAFVEVAPAPRIHHIGTQFTAFCANSQFSDGRDAQDAMEAMDKTDLEGRTVGEP